MVQIKSNQDNLELENFVEDGSDILENCNSEFVI